MLGHCLCNMILIFSAIYQLNHNYQKSKNLQTSAITSLFHNDIAITLIEKQPKKKKSIRFAGWGTGFSGIKFWLQCGINVGTWFFFLRDAGLRDDAGGDFSCGMVSLVNYSWRREMRSKTVNWAKWFAKLRVIDLKVNFTLILNFQLNGQILSTSKKIGFNSGHSKISNFWYIQDVDETEISKERIEGVSGES